MVSIDFVHHVQLTLPWSCQADCQDMTALYATVCDLVSNGAPCQFLRLNWSSQKRAYHLITAKECRKLSIAALGHHYTTASIKQDEAKHQFAKTLALPITTFPMTCSEAESITPYHSRCNDESYKAQESRKSEPSFVIHDGPPYANADLHIGESETNSKTFIQIRMHWHLMTFLNIRNALQAMQWTK